MREPSRIQLDVDELLDHLASRKTHLHPPYEVCLECQSALENAIQLYRGDFEELIYHGYFQSRLNQAFGRPICLFGIQFGIGLIIAALLFGLL